MDAKIDYSKYVTPTRFALTIGLVLAIQLLRSAGALTSDKIHVALAKLRDAAVAGQDLVVERLRTSPESLRPIDIRLDGGIVGLREVLEGKARLVGTEIASRAARLLALLFPEGTSFVLLPLAQEWIVVKGHLDRIVQDALEAEIDAVAGPEFLPFIRTAHAELGEGLGVGSTPLTESDSDSVREANQRLAKAIAAYGRAMVGAVDEDDPESVAAFKRAMYPLDAYRRAAFARAATGTETETEEPADSDVSPTDPIPPLPADPSA